MPVNKQRTTGPIQRAKHNWERLDDNTQTTHLSDNERYKPDLDDVNKALKVTLAYYDDTGNGSLSAALIRNGASTVRFNGTG